MKAFICPTVIQKCIVVIYITMNSFCSSDSIFCLASCGLDSNLVIITFWLIYFPISDNTSLSLSITIFLGCLLQKRQSTLRFSITWNVKHSLSDSLEKQSFSANRECKIEHAVSVCTNTALPVWKEVPSDSSAAQHSRRLLVRLTPHPLPPPPLFIASF